MGSSPIFLDIHSSDLAEAKRFSQLLALRKYLQQRSSLSWQDSLFADIPLCCPTGLKNFSSL